MTPDATNAGLNFSLHTRLFRILFSPRAIAAVMLIALPYSTARPQSASPSNKTEQSVAGDSQNGKKLFATFGCYECHGHQAEGASATGPRLGPNPIPFAALVKYIRQPTGEM